MDNDEQGAPSPRRGPIGADSASQRETSPDSAALEKPQRGLSTDELSRLRQGLLQGASEARTVEQGPIPPKPPSKPGVGERGHRIRSTRLQRVGHVNLERRKTSDELAEQLATAAQQSAAAEKLHHQVTILSRTFVLSQLLLFEAMLLPGYASEAGLTAPWGKMTDAASPNFVALFAFIVLSVIGLLPIKRAIRGPMLVGFGGLLMALGSLLIRDGLNRGMFDGQPGVVALFAGSIWPLLVVFALATLQLGWTIHRVIVGHQTDETRWGPTAIGAIGVGYVGFGFLLGRTDIMVLTLVSAGLGQDFFVDMLAALAALGPLVFGVFGWLRFRQAEQAHWGWACLCWSCWLGPLLLASFFSVHATQWGLVLAPVQCTSILAAGLLVASTGLALSPPRVLVGRVS